MSWILNLITNYYFVTFFVAWLTGCLIKALTKSYKNKKGFNLKEGFKNGGMPSTHSASVASIVTAIGYVDIVNTGEFSTVFFAGLVFAFIIVTDAFGVRQNIGKQGDVLNKLLKVVKKGKSNPIKVVYGHTALQVFMGVLWGIIVAVLMYPLYF